MAKRIQDEELLVVLLTSKTQTEAARKLGVSKQTITRRVKDPEFKAIFSNYRKSILDSVNTKLVNSSQYAVDVLVSLMDSKNELTRYNASSRILSLAQDYISMQDIVERIDKLEDIQANE